MNKTMKKRHYRRKTADFAAQAKQQPTPQVIPQGLSTAAISELLTDGRGLAKINGKAVMISGGLPDEQVEFEYLPQAKKQRLSGTVTQVLAASEHRVEPRCEVFGVCGGCVLQHLAAEQQIDFKEKQLISNLQKQAKITLKPKQLAAPLTAEKWGYRQRARVGIKQIRGEPRVHMGFRAAQSSQLVNISRCEVLAPALSDLLSPIAEMVSTFSQPDSVTQVEMALGEQGVALSFRHVLPLSAADMTALSSFAKQFEVMIYLQPDSRSDSLQALSVQQVINYRLLIQTDAELAANRCLPELTLSFLPYHFTQVNQTINQKMIKQAIEWLDLQADDCVLDLFCGLGNFTLPLAQRVKQVVGIEGSAALVDWAKQNAANNQIDNADFYQADLTQDTQMMSWRSKYRYQKLLIDPPRAGALDILPLINAIKPEKICYVSCHAATLARDIDVLVNRYGYRLQKTGVMDMFPQTAHVESMVLLVKK